MTMPSFSSLLAWNGACVGLPVNIPTRGVAGSIVKSLTYTAPLEIRCRTVSIKLYSVKVL